MHNGQVRCRDRAGGRMHRYGICMLEREQSSGKSMTGHHMTFNQSPLSSPFTHTLTHHTHPYPWLGISKYGVSGGTHDSLSSQQRDQVCQCTQSRLDHIVLGVLQTEQNLCIEGRGDGPVSG